VPIVSSESDARVSGLAAVAAAAAVVWWAVTEEERGDLWIRDRKADRVERLLEWASWPDPARTFETAGLVSVKRIGDPVQEMDRLEPRRRKGAICGCD